MLNTMMRRDLHHTRDPRQLNILIAVVLGIVLVTNDGGLRSYSATGYLQLPPSTIQRTKTSPTVINDPPSYHSEAPSVPQKHEYAIQFPKDTEHSTADSPIGLENENFAPYRQAQRSKEMSTISEKMHHMSAAVSQPVSILVPPQLLFDIFSLSPFNNGVKYSQNDIKTTIEQNSFSTNAEMITAYSSNFTQEGNIIFPIGGTEPDSIIRKSICFSEPYIGDCLGAFKRYYYNSTLDQCGCYFYGGCRDENVEGSGEFLASLSQCLDACQPSNTAPAASCRGALKPTMFFFAPAKPSSSDEGDSVIKQEQDSGLEIP